MDPAYPSKPCPKASPFENSWGYSTGTPEFPFLSPQRGLQNWELSFPQPSSPILLPHHPRHCQLPPHPVAPSTVAMTHPRRWPQGICRSLWALAGQQGHGAASGDVTSWQGSQQHSNYRCCSAAKCCRMQGNSQQDLSSFVMIEHVCSGLLEMSSSGMLWAHRGSCKVVGTRGQVICVSSCQSFSTRLAVLAIGNCMSVGVGSLN